MRIIVTGAKGFVGSVFALRAAERGHNVIALDDESRGLNQIEEKIGDSYRIHDCMAGIRSAVPWDRVDVVAHFAAATGSLERPLDELKTFNVDMTQNVYQDALALKAKAFLWPTTSLAIGVPDSPYVVSKELGLEKLKEVDREANISIPVRFFNVAGAYKGLTELRKNEVHLLPMLYEHLRNRTELIVNGDDYETADGTPSRTFVHVFDVVEYLLDLAMLKCAEAPEAIATPASDGAIWVGGQFSTTVRQAIQLVEQWSGGSLNWRIGPRRAYDCGALVCDPQQSRQFERARGGLAAPWVSIRDEYEALQAAQHERAVEELVKDTEQVYGQVVGSTHDR